MLINLLKNGSTSAAVYLHHYTLLTLMSPYSPLYSPHLGDSNFTTVLTSTWWVYSTFTTVISSHWWVYIHHSTLLTLMSLKVWLASFELDMTATTYKITGYYCLGQAVGRIRIHWDPGAAFCHAAKGQVRILARLQHFLLSSKISCTQIFNHQKIKIKHLKQCCWSGSIRIRLMRRIWINNLFLKIIVFLRGT